MLKNKKIEVFISYRNITHYRKLGYNAHIDTNLEINVYDLPASSHVKIGMVKTFMIKKLLVIILF